VIRGGSGARGGGARPPVVLSAAARREARRRSKSDVSGVGSGCGLAVQHERGMAKTPGRLGLRIGARVRLAVVRGGANSSLRGEQAVLWPGRECSRVG
jgi:hypothetical protein